jgi:hypothetical protein
VPKITIVDNEYASLWYYPKSKIVHHKIYKFMPTSLFRELLTSGVECIERHRGAKWLSDDRGNTVFRQEDVLWAHTALAPRLARARLKHWAIVMPAKAIGRMQMRPLIEQYGQLGVIVQAFSEPDDAMRWLESVDKAIEK